MHDSITISDHHDRQRASHVEFPVTVPRKEVGAKTRGDGSLFKRSFRDQDTGKLRARRCRNASLLAHWMSRFCRRNWAKA